MEFRLLGPLDAVEGGRAVELPRRKHRALLAALLLRAGEPVSTDRLIEDLWGESPPRTARDALQNYISLLRKALGADVLVTRDGSYLLDVSPEQVDLGQFERLTAEARTAASADDRAAKLREALGLWRGSPLADLVYEPFAAVEISRLEELRLAAAQDLIDAELELGRHADLVPELETLIQEHPFDERLRGQLMLALYRGGRQTEALEAYRSARRVLDEELGLEPGPPLRELEQAILRHDTSLGPSRPPPAQPSRRTVTVLVAGLDGDRDPEATAGQLAQLRAVVARHGGSTGPFAGDAAMAAFGVPHAHEDDALRAVRAAVEIHEQLPALRLGISTGEVFAGGEDVAGPPVTLARQLEQLARPGEILVSAPTLRLVRDAVRSRPAKRRGVTAFRVVELIEGAPGIARRLDRPLVGREQELAELGGAFAAARDDGRCSVFTVVGDAGMGKTRLARELLAEIEAMVLVGRCVAYGEGATFLPLTEMIGADILEAGSTGEIFLAARRRFEELASERPLLLVFEDVHWAEPTLLDFVEYLGAQATGSPILTLCLARPDLLAERPGWKRSLVLEPLTDDEARELAGDEPNADRIVEIAEGNPLYVEQLTAYAAEEGEAALETVPGSIEALLASRLDRLGPEERAVAQRAAVIGRRFSPAALAALGSVEGLAGLEEAGFVHRAPDVYRFHHVLVRDVAYAGLPKAERAELHQRHGDWLDGQPDGSDELIGYHLEQAAGYLGELGAPEQQVTRIATNAGRRLGAAGITAWKRGDTRATVNLLGRGTSLLSDRDPDRLEWTCELGLALRAAGELARAGTILRTACEEAAATGDRRIERRAGLEAQWVKLFVDSESRADDLLQEAASAVPVLEEHQDDRGLGRAWTSIAYVEGAYHSYRRREEAAARNALLHYRRAGWPFSIPLGEIASALFFGPTPVQEAIPACTALLEEADLNGQANVVAYLGGLEAMNGDFEQARTRMTEARQTFSELGQAFGAEITCGAIEGEIEVLAEDLRTARRALESSCLALEQRGEQRYLATRSAALAEVLCQQGEFEEAARRNRVARSGSTIDDVATEWRWRTVEAKLTAYEGDFAGAERLARAAYELLADTDALNHQAACLVSLGEVLSLADRPSEAVIAFERASELFEQKGNVVAARKTRPMTESP